MARQTQRNYLDPRTLNKISRLDLRARLIVEGFITGLHRSPYRGFAVEFAQHRQYVPGDETKHIDWKVWSKTDRLFIKEYEEETNLKCTMLLDVSRSMRYGEDTDQHWSKFDYSATLAACLAHLLQHQQDSVGLITFDNDIRLNMPASSHPTHLKQLVHELENTDPDTRTDVAAVFSQLAEQIRQRGMVVLISDLFADQAVLGEALQGFRIRGHEVVVFHVMHEDELDFPFQDNTLFRGLEIDRELLTEPRALRKAYLESKDRFVAQVRNRCATLGIDYVLMSTAEPIDAALSSYLAFRQQKSQSVRRR
jgi:uncharacterized protein (DUF58 family)